MTRSGRATPAQPRSAAPPSPRTYPTAWDCRPGSAPETPSGRSGSTRRAATSTPPRLTFGWALWRAWRPLSTLCTTGLTGPGQGGRRLLCPGGRHRACLSARRAPSRRAAPPSPARNPAHRRRASRASATIPTSPSTTAGTAGPLLSGSSQRRFAAACTRRPTWPGCSSDEAPGRTTLASPPPNSRRRPSSGCCGEQSQDRVAA